MFIKLQVYFENILRIFWKNLRTLKKLGVLRNKYWENVEKNRKKKIFF